MICGVASGTCWPANNSSTPERTPKPPHKRDERVRDGFSEGVLAVSHFGLLTDSQMIVTPRTMAGTTSNASVIGSKRFIASFVEILQRDEHELVQRPSGIDFDFVPGGKFRQPFVVTGFSGQLDVP